MIKWNQLIVVVLLMIFLSACAATGSTIKPVASPDVKASEINAQLGSHYLQQGQYAAAQKKLDKALKQNPHSAVAHNVMAALQMQLEQMEQAKFHFERAVALAPDYSEARNNYGVFLCGQGQYREAEQQFLSAIADPLYPQAAEAYENAGLCVQRIPNIARAEVYFNRALQIDKYMAKSLLQLGNISYDRGDYQQAESHLARYKEAARQGPKSLLLGIKVADKLGDQDAAASYRLLLRSQYPDSKEAKQVQQGQYQ